MLAVSSLFVGLLSPRVVVLCFFAFVRVAFSVFLFAFVWFVFFSCIMMYASACVLFIVWGSLGGCVCVLRLYCSFVCFLRLFVMFFCLFVFVGCVLCVSRLLLYLLCQFPCCCPCLVVRCCLIGCVFVSVCLLDPF